MATYKYNCKYRTLSIPLFDEGETIIYDCLCACNNLDVGSLHIYSKLRFRIIVTSFPICYDFTDTNCEEAVRSRMIDIMQKNPHISSSEIIKITGHSNSTIIRHYMSDSEIASMIFVEDEPATELGKEIQAAIVKTCEQYGNTISPCEFVAWGGQLFEKHICVKVIEPEENTKLCGPAAMNEIISYKNDILGLPRTLKWDEAFKNGVSTGIRYIDAFAARCAKEIEDATKNGSGSEIRIRVMKSSNENNLKSN